MPALPNAQHEAFARALVAGSSACDAYVKAGYKPHRANASRLSANDSIKARVAELTEKAAEKVGVTRERITAELAKIAFGDVRGVVRWTGELVASEEEGSEGQLIAANQVLLISSDKVTDDAAAMVAEIGQNATGGVRVKFHDKKAALELLGKDLGMFKDAERGTNIYFGLSDKPISPEQWAAEHGGVSDDGDGA